jgi:hypothetical protein
LVLSVSVSHCQSQFIEHKVGGFPAHLTVLGKADSGDAAFVYGDEIEGGEPFDQRYFGGMKEGASGYAGSFSADRTFVEVIAFNEVVVFICAVWADKHLRPSELVEVV